MNEEPTIDLQTTIRATERQLESLQHHVAKQFTGDNQMQYAVWQAFTGLNRLKFLISEAEADG